MAQRDGEVARRRLLVALSGLGPMALLVACGGRPQAASSRVPTGRPSERGSARATGAVPTSAPPAAGQGPVRVLYAGSLTTLMESALGPAFDQATGYQFQGEGKGSQALANLIKGKARAADVFVSADPTVNATLMGPANGDLVTWFLTMARTELVLAWSARSRFAPAFVAARDGQKAWYEVLQAEGLRLGRTDPQLDPKGYRTVWLFDLAEQYYHLPGLRASILGADGNQAQVFPEETLVARLQSGQLDAGIFYQNEAEEAHLPYLTLPAAINQGDPADAAAYATETFTDRQGITYRGSPILYTITIPHTSRNPQGAVRFVQFVLGATGQALLGQHGLLATPVQVGGDRAQVPAALGPFVTGPYAPPA